jgi:putative transposase
MSESQSTLLASKTSAPTRTTPGPMVPRCVEKDFDALIAFLEFPEEEWVSLRTTNGIERLNKEPKRRGKPIKIVAGERSS